VNYQGTRQKSGLSTGAIISTVLPVLPSDRSAASLSMAGFGNAFTPIDPVVLALLNVKSNQFGGAGGGWRIPSLPPTFDRTNRLVLSYDYALPFLAHTHGWQSAVLGPRSVSGITVFQSGLPFRLTDSAGASAYGTPTPNTATPSLAPGLYALERSDFRINRATLKRISDFCSLRSGSRCWNRRLDWLRYSGSQFVPRPHPAELGCPSRRLGRSPKNRISSFPPTCSALGIIRCSTSHRSPTSRTHHSDRSPIPWEIPD
jgi:hypothetical protein